MPKDETGLSWSGARKPSRAGGFVGSVSMNADPRPGLAVDPDGVAPAAPKKRESPKGGASVDLQSMEPAADPRERRSGRFKMPLG
jgi:hypothetical protein